MALKIFLIGHNGQVGWELKWALAPLGSLHSVDYPQIDLSQPDTFVPLIRELNPDLIVNPAAYTAVDRAESEPELAYVINAAAPGILAELAVELNAGFIHYSTDFVFNGEKGAPYVETDIPGPLSTYGRTKLAGDQAVMQVGGAYWIFRTSWVYSLRRDSFVTKVLEWARKHPTLRIVADQTGSPTSARMLAHLTALAIARVGVSPGAMREHAGLYNLAGSGSASRFEWAQAILANDPNPDQQIVKELLPALSTDFPTPALRPRFSTLDCAKFEREFCLTIPLWSSTLKSLFQHETK